MYTRARTPAETQASIHVLRAGHVDVVHQLRVRRVGRRRGGRRAVKHHLRACACACCQIRHLGSQVLQLACCIMLWQAPKQHKADSALLHRGQDTVSALQVHAAHLRWRPPPAWRRAGLPRCS